MEMRCTREGECLEEGCMMGYYSDKKQSERERERQEGEQGVLRLFYSALPLPHLLYSTPSTTRPD
jgi:hypothetical protein